MAKGSKIVSVRFEPELMLTMLTEIWRINERRKGEPFDVGSYIRTAVKEKIEHAYRSRKNGPFKTFRKLTKGFLPCETATELPGTVPDVQDSSQPSASTQQ